LAFEQGQGLVVQGTGVQHENRNGQAQFSDQVADDHIFCPQAGGLFDVRMLTAGASQCFTGFGQFV
jgi:hypothetical protein